MIIWAIVILFLIILLAETLLIISFEINFKTINPDFDQLEWPMVSVLVAVRNEEKNLKRCLDSLLRLDYPADKFEILIGDDHSEDATAAIISDYVQRVPNVKSIRIEEGFKGLIAKANVLAQLSAVSNSEFIAVLDADMEVQDSWLKTMVASAQKGYEMVSGYTEVATNGTLARLQNNDWLISLHSLKAFADIDQPLSALGNNMLVSAQALHKVGGFESLGATKVEDLKLMLKFKGHGFRIFQLISSQARAYTQPLGSFSNLLLQRKRWLSGLFSYKPWSALGFSVVRLSFILLFVALLFASGMQFYAIVLLLFAKLCVENLKFIQVRRQLDEDNFNLTWFKPIIISLLDTFALLSLVFSPSIMWKKRKL